MKLQDGGHILEKIKIVPILKICSDNDSTILPIFMLFGQKTRTSCYTSKHDNHDFSYLKKKKKKSPLLILWA